MKYCKGLLVMLLCGSGLFAGQYMPVSLTMDSILKGVLDSQGTNFAWKANQIYRYNYSKAMKRGSANLNLMLAKDIADISGNPSLDQASKMQLLRNSIDSLSRILESYRAMDTQQMPSAPQPVQQMPVYTPAAAPVPAPTTVLSLQSILNGALGEPYTFRANNVYNSGITVYVNDMINGINRDVNANYRGYESRQIDAIKATIDRNFDRVQDYRRTVGY